MATAESILDGLMNGDGFLQNLQGDVVLKMMKAG